MSFLAEKRCLSAASCFFPEEKMSHGLPLPLRQGSEKHKVIHKKYHKQRHQVSDGIFEGIERHAAVIAL